MTIIDKIKYEIKLFLIDNRSITFCFISISIRLHQYLHSIRAKKNIELILRIF